LEILGPSATFDLIASNDTFAFAHEAPIYSPTTDEIFFVSNDGGPLGMSDLNHNNQISKISLAQVETALASSGGGSVNVNITKVGYVICLFIYDLLMLEDLSASTSQHDPNDKRWYGAVQWLTPVC
jgi:hypothetical protein